jgi:hypothetical protein
LEITIMACMIYTSPDFAFYLATRYFFFISIYAAPSKHPIASSPANPGDCDLRGVAAGVGSGVADGVTVMVGSEVGVGVGVANCDNSSCAVGW